MDQERRKDIALMRYSVIAPLITGLSDDYDSLEAFFAVPRQKVLFIRMAH